MIDEQSELISAMSSLNTHDERKPYDGPFLTEEIADIKLASLFLGYAFDLLINKEKLFNQKYINYCRSAIVFLNRTDWDGNKHSITHSMVAHSIIHIEAAIQLNKERNEISNK